MFDTVFFREPGIFRGISELTPWEMGKFSECSFTALFPVVCFLLAPLMHSVLCLEICIIFQFYTLKVYIIFDFKKIE